MEKSMYFDYAGLLFDCKMNKDTLCRAHKLVYDYLLREISPPSVEEISESSLKVAGEYFAERKECKVIEWSLEKIVKGMFRNFKIPMTSGRIREVCEIYKWNNHDYAPKEYVIEEIPKLADKFKLGIISNSTHNSLIKELEEYNLLHFFDNITFSYEVGRRKPHPSIYLSGLAKANIKPEGAMFVSHDEEELEGARNVGMNTYLINDKNGNSIKDLEDLKW